MPEEKDVFIPTEEEQKDSVFIKCDGCGSNMFFNPVTQTLKCDYCGREEDFEKDKDVKERAIEKGFEDASTWSGETSTYSCSNCGAKFVVQADESAVKCPYCSTTHIVKTEDLAGIKPNAVYPFLLDAATAVQASKKWAKKRIFAPRKFKKNLEERNLNGIYLPCFTFDSKTQSVYNGRLGETRTRTVRKNGKSYTQTYTVWHNVSGRFNRDFDDVTISSGNTPQSEISKLEPFNAQSLCVYEKKFLSGFSAGHYSRDIKVCWGDAKDIMDARIRREIIASYGYDKVDYLNVSTIHNDVTFKYVLLPVYRLNYKYKNKEYPISVNGNTGKVTGKSPVSPLRVVIAVALGIALFVALYLLTTA